MSRDDLENFITTPPPEPEEEPKREGVWSFQLRADPRAELQVNYEDEDGGILLTLPSFVKGSESQGVNLYFLSKIQDEVRDLVSTLGEEFGLLRVCDQYQGQCERVDE